MNPHAIPTHTHMHSQKRELDKWASYESADLPVVLFANKIDKLTCPQSSFALGAKMENLCRRHGFAAWYVTSARTCENVEQGWGKLAELVADAEGGADPDGCTNDLTRTGRGRAGDVNAGADLPRPGRGTPDVRCGRGAGADMSRSLLSRSTWGGLPGRIPIFSPLMSAALGGGTLRQLPGSSYPTPSPATPTRPASTPNSRAAALLAVWDLDEID